MPQLKLETFVTQYFWLIVILLGFYYVLVTIIIPRISEVIKTRKKLETVSLKTSEIDTLSYNKSLVIQSLITSPKAESNSQAIFKKNIESWASNYLKK